MNLELILSATQIIGAESDIEAIHVVCLSDSETPVFIPAHDRSNLRKRLSDSIAKGGQPLGLLGWKRGPDGWEAQSALFPWIERDGKLALLFGELCREGVDAVLKPIG